MWSIWCWHSSCQTSHKVIILVIIFQLLFLHLQPELTIINGSRMAPMHIRYLHTCAYWYSLIWLETPIGCVIPKQGGAKQEKANAFHHQVSYFINFSPGFIWGNKSGKFSSLMWSTCLCCNPTEETQSPNICTSSTLEDAVKVFNCLHS